MHDQPTEILWLEFSGLPAALNRVRANGWLVFKTLAEIDARAARRPGIVEMSIADLAPRCGLEPDAAAKVVEALRKKKYLKCYLPEHHEEESLIEIWVPVETPIAPEEVARTIPDLTLRDPLQYRYARAAEAPPAELAKVQAVADMYLNRMSQKVNSFVVEQIEIAASRFEIEDIERTIERAARHEVRQFGWVLKELVREQGKRKKGDEAARQ